MLAVIVADAPAADIHEFRPLLERAGLCIAADGGARYLLALNLRPHLVVGDLDSLSSDTLEALRQQGVAIERYAAEKDQTDLELALLRAIEQGASQVVVLAALGGRPDQHMANLLLLAHPLLRGHRVLIRDGAWEVRFIDGSAEISGHPGDLVSLLPLSTVHGVTTEGLSYPLQDETLLLGPSRGVSNMLLAERARVSVRDGLLLLFQCRSEEPASAGEG